jgi:membrane-bound lytic murein transglycosylase D
MYGTGKLDNLKINSYLDERCDPYKSTVAACEYIQFLYDMFGDWQMTIAAYNCGPGAISKAIRRSGGKTTYWEIRPYLPRETQGYVPAFIAATYVMNFAGEHNLYEYAPKKTFFQVDTVEIKQQITFEQISAVLGIPVEELQYLNPGYKRNVIPFVEGEKNALCLPNSKLGSFITNEQAIYDLVKKDTLAAKTEPVKEIMKLHTVRRGEHINAIANRYKVTVADIMAWNDLKNMKLWAGQKLTIYVPVRNPASQSAEQSSVTKNKKQPVITTASSAKTAPMPSSGKYKYHTIQKGDSLWTIAQKHGTTVDELKRLNHLGKRYMLHPGMKIKVGVAG